MKCTVPRKPSLERAMKVGKTSGHVQVQACRPISWQTHFKKPREISVALFTKQKYFNCQWKANNLMSLKIPRFGNFACIFLSVLWSVYKWLGRPVWESGKLGSGVMWDDKFWYEFNAEKTWTCLSLLLSQDPTVKPLASVKCYIFSKIQFSLKRKFSKGSTINTYKNNIRKQGDNLYILT